MFVFNLAFQIANEQIRIAKCFFPYSVSRAEESYLFTKLPSGFATNGNNFRY